MSENKGEKRLSQKDILNKFYNDFNLNVDSDVHTQTNKQGKVMYRIITRHGIEKIQAALNVSVRYEVMNPSLFHPAYKMEYTGAITNKQEKFEYDEQGQRRVIGNDSYNSKNQAKVNLYQVVLKGIGVLRNENGEIIKEVETFGEASELNCRSTDYLWAMAEKRALARVVLKLAGMYAYGFFSEDEADEFKDIVKAGQARVKREG